MNQSNYSSLVEVNKVAMKADLTSIVEMWPNYFGALRVDVSINSTVGAACHQGKTLNVSLMLSRGNFIA